MKKFLIAILCITVMLFGMSVPSYAADKPVFTVGRAYATSGEVDIPVYITAIPEEVENIMSMDFKYSYDTNMLEYVKTTPGTASGSLFTAADGEVHWADAADIAVDTPKVNPETVGKDNPLFVITFNIIGSGSTHTDILADKVSLSSGNLQPGAVFEIIKLTDSHFNAVSGRVIYKDAPAGDDTGSDDGDDTTGDTTDTPDDGDDTTGDTTDTPDDGDDTTGDTTETPDDGDDTTGDTTETPDDKGDSSAGGNTGGLKPNTGGNTGGNNSGNSGGNTSGNKPSGNSGFGGGTAVVPQTPAETDDTAKPSKASEVFSDVTDDHWAASYALALYNKGIVSGDSSKRANLENKITREETSKLALLVNGIEVDTTLKLDVADASSVSDWAISFMATAIKEGIFSGYGDGSVKPLNHITREEMVTVIIKSLKIDIDAEAAVSFADGSSITWSAPYVSKAVELGFVNGYSDNTFKPENPITRAEAFAIFARVLEYKNK